MVGCRTALLLTLAGCGQVIGIRDLGVETPALEGDGGTPAGAVDSGADGEACSAPDVAGQWRGSLVGGAFLGAKSVEGNFLQKCTVITGSMTVDRCIVGGKLVATIDESGALDGNVTAGSTTMTLRGTLSSPNQYKGDFVFPQPAQLGKECSGASGTFQLDRP